VKILALLVLVGCGEDATCGPEAARVARVLDGDTLELDSGERVRYLLVDTPETDEGECFAGEAAAFNRALVEGQRITLAYDPGACRDRHERLLAYVSVDGREINSLLVERGHACVLYVPPGGQARREGFESLEYAARAAGKGLWGACAAELPCR
jgi:micrococcal nuclease